MTCEHSQHSHVPHPNHCLTTVVACKLRCLATMHFWVSCITGCEAALRCTILDCAERRHTGSLQVVGPFPQGTAKFTLTTLQYLLHGSSATNGKTSEWLDCNGRFRSYMKFTPGCAAAICEYVDNLPLAERAAAVREMRRRCTPAAGSKVPLAPFMRAAGLLDPAGAAQGVARAATPAVGAATTQFRRRWHRTGRERHTRALRTLLAHRVARGSAMI